MQASLKNLTKQLQDPMKAFIALAVVAVIGFFVFKKIKEGNENQGNAHHSPPQKKPTKPTMMHANM